MGASTCKHRRSTMARSGVINFCLLAMSTAGVAAAPCPVNAAASWVVDDAASAVAMTEALNCSGGAFDVEWRGRVVVDRAIYVTDGTSLNVTGADSDAEIVGAGDSRLFTVTDASLEVYNMIFSNGNATKGGAIYAARSNIRLARASFLSNAAGIRGGGVYIEVGSNLSCGVDTSFLRNTAGEDGGALFVGYASRASWEAETSHSENTALDGSGGAVFVGYGSSIYWGAKASFVGNFATKTGGAAVIVNDSTASWQAEASFSNNTALLAGGAVAVFEEASVTWEGETSFFNNTAGRYGGAVYPHSSVVSWGAETTFFNNIANDSGGAINVGPNASISWEGETSFSGNSAQLFGGAVHLYPGSSMSYKASTSFSGNTAQYGGAVYLRSGSSMSGKAETLVSDNTAETFGGAVFVWDGSHVTWEAETSFSGNAALYGGAIFAYGHSTVSWTAESSFSGNTAESFGGAVVIWDGPNISWGAAASFSGNRAFNGSGGAVYAYGSNVSWKEETSFVNNTALNGGGAVYVFTGATVSWEAKASFSNNTAEYGGAAAVYGARLSWEAGVSFSRNFAFQNGGAVAADGGASLSWEGKTEFVDNTARGILGGGGAVLVSGASNISSKAEISFSGNTAEFSGGAVHVKENSIAFWGAESSFVDNAALFSAGAVYVSESTLSWEAKASFFNNTSLRDAGGVYAYGSTVSWETGVLFYGNTAGFSGGALHIATSSASWGGEASFLHNHAGGDGGAVSVEILNSENPRISSLTINGSTMFFNNSCRLSGGGMTIAGSMDVDFLTENVTFSENSAGVAGGAIYMSGALVGLHFVGTRFISNYAQIGGGVHATGSGTVVADYEEKSPTTFDRCTFYGNEAVATGGAVDTGAGVDAFIDSRFVGNGAGVGGGLRLAGKASLNNCTFIENVSGDGAGPAVSNIGYISSIYNSSFEGNVFSCDSGTFLDFVTVNDAGEEDLFGIVCEACDTSCDGCSFQDEIQLPLCTEEMANSVSAGGDITLETISIQPGYWRATSTSRAVLACYNADACLGGVTGTSGYCASGYEGPYCSVCSEGYSAGLGFTCSECPDSEGGAALVAVIAVLAVVAFAAFVSYMVSAEKGSADRGVVDRVARYIPLQSIKIVIAAWQILTQFAEVANVTYPDVYQRFLDGIDIINFDLGWILSAGCVFDMDFHDRLILATIGPLIGTAALGATYLVATSRNAEYDTALGVVRKKHLSMVLLLTFVVYSSVSSTLFQTYGCDKLQDGNNYLRADYRIECDSSKHRSLQVYAGLMIVLYTVGIPVFYATLLYKNRTVLTDKVGRETDERAMSISELWKAYKPDRFFYELIDLGRRIMLAAVVVFIFPNSNAQIAVTLILAGFFFVVFEALAPYASPWDSWVSRMGHAIIFMSMYVALLLRVDVSNEQSDSQRAFEVILVFAHACMVLAVVVEAAVIVWSLKKAAREDPTPRMFPGITNSASGVPKTDYGDDSKTQF